MGFRIGKLELESNLFLSPLAGYTNLPFRLVIREVGGAGLCTTDLVNARSLIEKNRKAFKLIESCPQDRPVSVQLFGSIPEEMRDAALFLQERGVDSVDINMGCPVRKVCKVGGGSAMMTEHKKTSHLVQMMVDALKIPVTAKMRLGWDNENITAPDLARALEDVGVSAITIHGRTREQGFKGKVHLAGIRAVVQAVRNIPIIGNGDITTPEAARIMFEETGCAAIGIGRGAFYNPWIFLHIQHYLNTGQLLSEPSFEERIRVMRRHLDQMVHFFGEETGCRMFRKVATWYSKRFGPAAEFNRQVVGLKTRSEFNDILNHYINWRHQFLDENGTLRPQYESQPMSLNFLREEEPPITRREAIPVPVGPNEWW
jgi:nifR3 family TIM-barrel protein